MYLYFDSNGNLQEVVNTKQVIQSETSNVIYCYFEGITLSQYTYSLTLTRPNATLVGTKTGVSVTTQIPYDKTQDLRYFKYYQDYDFISFTLNNSTDLTVNGVYVGNPQINNKTTKTITFYNPITFEVQTNNILADTNINSSQYAYLLSLASAGGNLYPVAIDLSLSEQNDLQVTLTREDGTALTDSVSLPFGSYLTIDSFNSAITSYVTKTQLTTALSDYVTNSSLSNTLSNYVTNSSLSSNLSNYVTNSYLATSLGGYLPLAGGTLTGALVGTSIKSDNASRNDSATIDGQYISLANSDSSVTAVMNLAGIQSKNTYGNKSYFFNNPASGNIMVDYNVDGESAISANPVTTDGYSVVLASSYSFVRTIKGTSLNGKTIAVHAVFKVTFTANATQGKVIKLGNITNITLRFFPYWGTLTFGTLTNMNNNAGSKGDFVMTTAGIINRTITSAVTSGTIYYYDLNFTCSE